MAKSGKDGTSFSFVDVEGDLGGLIGEDTSFCEIANGRVSEFNDTLKALKTQGRDGLLEAMASQSLTGGEREALTDLVALLRFLPSLDTRTMRIYPALQGLRDCPTLLYGLEGLVGFAFRGEPKDKELVALKAFAKEEGFGSLTQALFPKALAPVAIGRIDERTVFPLALAFSLLANSRLEGKGGLAFVKAVAPLEVGIGGGIDFEKDGNTIQFGPLFALTEKSGLAADLGLSDDPDSLLGQWIDKGLALKGKDGKAYFTVLGRAVCAFIDARIYASRESQEVN